MGDEFVPRPTRKNFYQLPILTGDYCLFRGQPVQVIGQRGSRSWIQFCVGGSVFPVATRSLTRKGSR